MNPNSDLEKNNSETSSPEPVRSTSRVSLPVRFANPAVPESERPIADLSTHFLEGRTDQLTSNNDSLLAHVNRTIVGVDTSLNRTDNLLIQFDTSTMSNNTDSEIGDLDRQLRQTMGDENMSRNSQSTTGPNGQNNVSNEKQTSNGREKTRESLGENDPPEATHIPTEAEIRKVQTYLNNQRSEDRHESSHDRNLYDDSEAIGLEAALRLLPHSFSGERQEDAEVFLEKCEFAISCARKSTQQRLLKGILVRLTGKARQAVKFKTFNSWDELRDTLKSALEPQRTTTHLYLDLYSTKQKAGESIMSYSTRIEELQNIILEQETSGKTVDVAKALEASLKAQSVQVFVEGLGVLKDFIKARDPPTLEKAIQAAKEEERVRNSSQQNRKLYGPPQKSNNSLTKVLTCFNCNKNGHMAKDCHVEDKRIQKPQINTSVRSIQNLSCSYCKKPGHSINECRKRKYVNEKRSLEQGNSTRPDTAGGRPVGDIKIAVFHRGETQPTTECFSKGASTSNQN